MRLLIPILTRQIPRWEHFGAPIPFAVGEGVEIDVEEGSDLLYVVSVHLSLFLVPNASSPYYSCFIGLF